MTKPDYADFMHKDLTEQLIGAAFKVYNKIGYGFREKEYQRAYASELVLAGLGFTREVYGTLKYNEKVISKFYLDFLVEEKVVVELKVAEDFYKKHFEQVMAYLREKNLNVGLLIIFTSQRVLVKRIVRQTSA